MKYLLTFLSFISFFHYGQAQEIFQRSYGGSGSDHGKAVIECSSGGYLVVGSTNSFNDPSADMYLLRVDESGEYIWGKSIGEPGTLEWAVDVFEADDGSFYIAGYGINAQNSSYDGILLKTDSEGNEQWTRYYGTDDWDFFESLVPGNDGAIYIAGQTTISGSQKGWILKLDDTGDELEETLVEDSGDVNLTGISTCGNGALVFSGDTYNSQTGERYFMGGKLSETGELEWTTILTEHNFSAGECACDSEFNLVSAGTQTPDQSSGGSTNVGAVSLSGPDGTLNWFLVLYTELNFQGHGVAIDDNDFIYIAGGGENICCDGFDGYTTVRNSAGEFFSSDFVDAFGGTERDMLFDMAITSDGGYIAVGESRSFGNNFQTYLVKLDADGTHDPTNEDYLDIITTDHIIDIESKLSIYPNPTTNQITVEAPFEIARVSLFSTSGQFLHEKKLPPGKSSTSIDMSTLSTGFYTIIIELSQGGIIHRKVSRI